MFDMIINSINDMITYINSFINTKDTTDNNNIYNLLIFGFIIYVVIQLLHVFKININYTI
jgi:tetrahydromethanopterin S-methyltransferase subunit B